jgi:choline-sulfatase
VVNSDHGLSLWENGCYEKHTFAPQNHRVPFIISWRGTLPANRTDTRLCQGLDLPRTLFALTDIETPPQFKGRDLFGEVEPEAVFASIGYGFTNSRAFPYLDLGMYPDGRGWPRRACVRTPHYRLDRNIRQNGAPIESGDSDRDLFFTDLAVDPEEQKNYATDPAYADTVTRLSRMLDRHLRDCVEPSQDFLDHSEWEEL